MYNAVMSWCHMLGQDLSQLACAVQARKASKAKRAGAKPAASDTTDAAEDASELKALQDMRAREGLDAGRHSDCNQVPREQVQGSQTTNAEGYGALNSQPKSDTPPKHSVSMLWGPYT